MQFARIGLNVPKSILHIRQIVLKNMSFIYKYKTSKITLFVKQPAILNSAI